MAAIHVSCPSTGRALSSSRACQNWKLFHGLRDVNSILGSTYASRRSSFQLACKSPFYTKDIGKTKAALISGHGGLLSYSNESSPDAATSAARAQSDATAAFDDDLDHPTEGFSSITEAIEEIRRGKMVVVVDDEDIENGDLVMAAQLATPEAMAFIVKHGSGIICVSMKSEDLDRLELPLMVTEKENDKSLSKATAFTITVDAKHGITTGVSAQDRATTVLALASQDSKPEDFYRPGCICPLRYREGGVLKRAGHTEASVDLAQLAGLKPVGVLCEIVDDDGSMARLPKLREFAQKENSKIISIADLISSFTAYYYRSILDGIEHITMVKRDVGDKQDILVRVHSKCLIEDIFRFARGDCGSHLALAMKKFEAIRRGMVIYLQGHEGRGVGLAHKLHVYTVQDAGRDTIKANEEL